MEYKKLESLVPPLELCKQIPAGEFADSYAVWVVKPHDQAEVWERVRAQVLPQSWNTYPAPTLAEILEKFPSGTTFIATVFRNSWVISHFDSSQKGQPAAAALQVWFDVKGQG